MKEKRYAMICFAFTVFEWLQVGKDCMVVVNRSDANCKISFPFAGHSRDDLVTSRLLEGWYIFGVAHLRIPANATTIPAKNSKPCLACPQMKRMTMTVTWQMRCCADWRKVLLASKYLQVTGGLLSA